jgi:hypothetical protein
MAVLELNSCFIKKSETIELKVIENALIIHQCFSKLIVIIKNIII